MVTASDFFCGAGGSSTGMAAAGAEIRAAVNHWSLAIETHNTNHPDTEHYLDDIQATHPSRYPYTDLLWMSPECTNHSIAKGKQRKAINQLNLWSENRVDPAEERSRATMREVVKHAEYHRNSIIIVENVVDIRHWQYYDTWLTAMLNLGYHYRTLYLNAQFFGVPQSRDRWYTVFWRRGNKAPDLDFRPAAYCPKCEQLVSAVQAWKKPEFHWGRYGTNRQYVYKCPACASQVHPGTVPAAAIINWSLPAERIGDRAKPLRPKTLDRIRAGIRKFARPVVIDTSMTHAGASGKVRPTDEPLATQTTRQSMAVSVPPQLVSVNYFDDRTIQVGKPMATQTSANKYGVVVPPFILSYMNNATPPRAVDEPMYTVATTHTPPVVLPPFLMSYYSREDAQSDLNAPLPVIPTERRHSLIIPPFISSYYGTGATNQVVYEPVNAITSRDHHALITPELIEEDVEEILMASRFRMLTPEELKLGMSFPQEYTILGNQKNQVKQIGNAVCCAVAEWITRRCIESLM
jgi:DNA (cytosine-5)-methyltransferase 1